MQMSEIAKPSVFVHTPEPVAFVPTCPPAGSCLCPQSPALMILPNVVAPSPAPEDADSCRLLVEPGGHIELHISAPGRQSNIFTFITKCQACAQCTVQP